jgi:hypothetical protein
MSVQSGMRPAVKGSFSRCLRALVVIAFAAFTVTVSAQQMPDISMMAGMPLGAPELPDGSVTVRVLRERLGNNVVNHPVTLKGAQVSQTVNTDSQGRATFTGLEVGTVVVATTEVDGETLQSEEFDIPAKGGVRIALVAGLAQAQSRERAQDEAAAKEPARPGVVVFGGDTRIIFEFQDDNLNAFYLLDIVNGARTPIDTGEPLVLELPANAVGPATMEGSSSLATLNGKRLTITGPFPPGTTSVQVAYTVPYDGDTVTLEQRWPAPVESMFVAIEQVGSVRLASPQLPEQQEAQASGTRFVMARGDRINANEPLTLTISGLPYRDMTVRNIGVGLALLILAAGLWSAFTGAPARQNEAAKLVARREKLFAELVELERQRKAGRVDEQRYATKRQQLTTQLERVLGELDRGGEGVAA